jgi:hypothetical protein
MGLIPTECLSVVCFGTECVWATSWWPLRAAPVLRLIVWWAVRWTPFTEENISRSSLKTTALDAVSAPIIVRMAAFSWCPMNTMRRRKIINRIRLPTTSGWLNPRPWPATSVTQRGTRIRQNPAASPPALMGLQTGILGTNCYSLSSRVIQAVSKRNKCEERAGILLQNSLVW